MLGAGRHFGVGCSGSESAQVYISVRMHLSAGKYKALKYDDLVLDLVLDLVMFVYRCRCKLVKQNHDGKLCENATKLIDRGRGS